MDFTKEKGVKRTAQLYKEEKEGFAKEFEQFCSDTM